MAEPTRNRANALLGELSGAVADFGTFLPLVVGVLAVARFEATPVLTGFGLFALAVAVHYRRPIPVQPMKVITALIIVGALSPEQTMAAGLMVGGVLLLLVVTRLIGRIAALVPVSVILGIQVGVGAKLAILGLQHVEGQPAYGIAALLVLIVLFFTRFRSLSCLLIVVLATAIAVATSPTAVRIGDPGFALPSFVWPVWEDFRVAALVAVLPQLALTLSNAVLATAAIAAECFPDDRNRLSAPRLAASTGILNLVLTPLGALPMCHGSGGLIAQYAFGARTWLAPAAFGAFCLVLGLGFGAGARDLLAAIPIGAVGAMLVVAGAQLAISPRISQVKPSCRVVIALTGIVCIVTDIATGLLVGLVLEAARTAIVRFRGRNAEPL